jgi:hypothetical protein
VLVPKLCEPPPEVVENAFERLSHDADECGRAPDGYT